MSKSKKVLIAVTNQGRMGEAGPRTGFHLAEVSHPLDVFREEGFEVDFVSPSGGLAPMDPNSEDRDDPLNAAFLDNQADQELLENTMKPEEVNPSHYRGIYFAGGHGTMWDFPDSEGLQHLAREIHHHGGVVGAVCHGPAVFVNLRLPDGKYFVEGREVAAFTDDEERAVEKDTMVPFLLASRLEEIGAKHTKADNFARHVVVSNKLITGQNPASARGVGQEMVAQMKH